MFEIYISDKSKEKAIDFQDKLGETQYLSYIKKNKNKIFPFFYCSATSYH